MCFIDMADGLVTVLSDTHPKARKPHRCIECGRTIPPGERYERIVVKFDGTIHTYRTCAHCEEARNWLLWECSGWLYHGVYDDLAEHVYEGDAWKYKAAGILAGAMRKGWEGWTPQDAARVARSAKPRSA